MNYIILSISGSYDSDRKNDIFGHKLEALCLEYDVSTSYIFSKNDLKEFVDEVPEDD